MSDELYKAAQYKSPKVRSAKRFKCSKGYHQYPPKSRNCVSNRKKTLSPQLHWSDASGIRSNATPWSPSHSGEAEWHDDMSIPKPWNDAPCRVGDYCPKGKRCPKRSRKNSKKTCIRTNKSDSKSY